MFGSAETGHLRGGGNGEFGFCISANDFSRVLSGPRQSALRVFAKRSLVRYLHLPRTPLGQGSRPAHPANRRRENGGRHTRAVCAGREAGSRGRPEQTDSRTDRRGVRGSRTSEECRGPTQKQRTPAGSVAEHLATEEDWETWNKKADVLIGTPHVLSPARTGVAPVPRSAFDLVTSMRRTTYRRRRGTRSSKHPREGRSPDGHSIPCGRPTSARINRLFLSTSTCPRKGRFRRSALPPSRRCRYRGARCNDRAPSDRAASLYDMRATAAVCLCARIRWTTQRRSRGFMRPQFTARSHYSRHTLATSQAMRHEVESGELRVYLRRSPD